MNHTYIKKNRIALSIQGYAPRLGFAEIFQESLTRLGFEVLLCRDGDTQALQADRILLVGCSYHYPQYIKLFTEQRTNRPEVVLWQFEPVPMADLSTESLSYAQKILDVDYRHFTSIKRMLTCWIPGRRHLRNLCWKIIFNQFYKTLTDTQKQAYKNVALWDLYFTMNEGVQILKHYHPDWCDVCAASTPPRVEFLRAHNIPAYYAPMGYHSGWGHPMKLSRDIDVVFMGNLKGYRNNQIDRIRRQLTKDGIEVYIAQGYYGKKRTELLNRAKIILDLTRLGWELPIMRLLSAMSCGALLITNWTGSPVPFSHEHLVQRNLEDFPDAVRYYLNHESERLAITEKAAAFTMNELTLPNVMRRLLMERKSWEGIPVKPIENIHCAVSLES